MYANNENRKNEVPERTEGLIRGWGRVDTLDTKKVALITVFPHTEK